MQVLLVVVWDPHAVGPSVEVRNFPHRCAGASVERYKTSSWVGFLLSGVCQQHINTMVRYHILYSATSTIVRVASPRITSKHK